MKTELNLLKKYAARYQGLATLFRKAKPIHGAPPLPVMEDGFDYIFWHNKKEKFFVEIVPGYTSYSVRLVYEEFTIKGSKKRIKDCDDALSWAAIIFHKPHLNK